MQTDEISRLLVSYLESGSAPNALFTDDVFLDFTLPHWRMQAQGLEDVLQSRRQGHPGPSHVPRWAAQPTPDGFVMELEERWVDAKSSWYCREVIIARLRGNSISRLSVYCTGDWDADRQAMHSKQVRLLEP